MVHKNKMWKYPVNTACQNVSCLLLWLKSRLEKDVISAGHKQDFLSHPTNPYAPMIKSPPKNKNKDHNFKIEKQTLGVTKGNLYFTFFSHST